MKENLSLIEFSKSFPDESSCLSHIEKVRWSDSIQCPKCKSHKIYILSNPKLFRCGSCFKNFSHTSGTIFSKTKCPLQIWFFIVYIEALNKKNISSIQMSKNLGVTQKTAWGMQQKIRKALVQDDILLSGIVEVDEAFVSRSDKGYTTNWGGISTRKEPILGLIERGGKVVIKCIEDRKRTTIIEIIKKHVLPGSTIYTDGAPVYSKLPKHYIHDFVEHSTREYVRGEVHTNNIESVWSHFKKSIRNAHHQVSAKHLQLYCDHMVFRYNNRHLEVFERFNKILSICLNK